MLEITSEKGIRIRYRARKVSWVIYGILYHRYGSARVEASSGRSAPSFPFRAPEDQRSFHFLPVQRLMIVAHELLYVRSFPILKPRTVHSFVPYFTRYCTMAPAGIICKIQIDVTADQVSTYSYQDPPTNRDIGTVRLRKIHNP